MNRNELLDMAAMKIPAWPKEVDQVMSYRESGFNFVNGDETGFFLKGSDYSSLAPTVTRPEYLKHRLVLINEPDNSDAPDWANWKAQGPISRCWFWTKEKPEIIDNGVSKGWTNGGGTMIASSGRLPVGHDWRDTLKPTRAGVEAGGLLHCVCGNAVAPDSYSARLIKAHFSCPGCKTEDPTDGRQLRFSAKIPSDFGRRVSSPELEKSVSKVLKHEVEKLTSPSRTTESASDILDAAGDHLEQRAEAYDKQDQGGERPIAAAVEAFHAVTGDGHMNTSERGWLFMMLLKAVRTQQGDYRADNYQDATAYAALMGEAASEERGNG